MEKNWRVWLICCLFFSLQAAALAQQPAEEVKKYIQFSLNTNKGTYICGEPIILNIQMQNTGDKPIQFSSVLTPTADVEINIYRPERFPLRYTGTFRPAIYPTTIFWLEPGEVRTLRFMLLYDEKAPAGFLTAEAGPLRIVCRLFYIIRRDIPLVVNFSPLDVNITKDTRVNNQVFKLLQEEQIARELTDGAATPDKVALYKQIAENYAESIFAPYCLFAITGLYLNQLHQDIKTSESLLLQPLDRIIAKYPDFPLMDSVFYRYATFYYLKNHHKEARRWLVRLHNKFPDSPKIRRGDPLINQLLYGGKEIDFEIPPTSPEKDWLLY